MAKELVEIELDVPLKNVNEDVPHGGKVYYGKVKVTPEMAEDLKRREHEYHEYERNLIRNNGKQINAGDIIGNAGD